jgi:hypothetical protein
VNSRGRCVLWGRNFARAVRGYFAASRIPFPDQADEIIAIGASGDSVLSNAG